MPVHRILPVYWLIVCFFYQAYAVCLLLGDVTNFPELKRYDHKDKDHAFHSLFNLKSETTQLAILSIQAHTTFCALKEKFNE